MNHNCYTQFTLFDCVIISFHIAMNILGKFDLLNENDHAQDYDFFLYMTQSRYDSIDYPVYDYHLCQFVMVVIVIVILFADCVTLYDRNLWQSLLMLLCMFHVDCNRNSLSLLAFGKNNMNLMHIVTAVTNRFGLCSIITISILIT